LPADEADDVGCEVVFNPLALWMSRVKVLMNGGPERLQNVGLRQHGTIQHPTSSPPAANLEAASQTVSDDYRQTVMIGVFYSLCALAYASCRYSEVAEH